MGKTGSIIEIHWNYTHDDFGYTAPVETMENFFREGKQNRERFAKYLEKLADQCRRGEYPFQLLK